MFGKATSSRRGFLLLESAMALGILTVISLLLLKLSLNVLHPRQWTMIQTMTDAYMGIERASAEREPFSTIPGWPARNNGLVAIGRFPDQVVGAADGAILRGNILRTATVISPAINPAGMTVYQLKSVLTYNVPSTGRSYVKSRTIIRSQ